MSFDKVVKLHSRARGHLQRTLPFRRPASTEEFQAPVPTQQPVLPPMKKPNVFCEDQNFSETIVPLYARGWNVVYKIRYQKTSGKVIPKKIPTLTGFYKFTSFRTAVFFAEDVGNVLGKGSGVRPSSSFFKAGASEIFFRQRSSTTFLSLLRL
jgi:hypothetical protein